MFKEKIELVDSVMSEGGVWSHKRQAWYCLKKFLEEAQKTSDNSGSITIEELNAAYLAHYNLKRELTHGENSALFFAYKYMRSNNI